MPRAKHKASEGCELNMTPMIDVVFQLIIFFIVTLKMTKTINEEIILEDGKHGEIIKNPPPQQIEIEVDRRGRISIHNAQLSRDELRQIIQSRFNRFGAFPVLIRADQKTQHDDVKRVMDICTGVGVWKVGFVAIQEHKAKRR